MIPWYISFTKIFFMNISVIYVLLKIINYKDFKLKKIILLMMANIGIAMCYSFYRAYLGMPLSYLVYYFLFVVVFSIIINIDILYSMTLTSIGCSLSLGSMIIATIYNFILIKLIGIRLDKYYILEYFNIGIIQWILLYVFFSIKRFKDGFSFLQSTDNKSIVDFIGIFISIIAISICILYAIYRSYYIRTLLVVCFGIGGILMVKWIRSSITKHYKEKMKDRTVELQAEQIKEKDEMINSLKKELSNALAINHKYNHRLSAMEKAVSKLGKHLEFNEEFANEYEEIIVTLKELSKEYKDELYNSSDSSNLPKTNVFSIDNLLEYMKTQAIREKIKFDLELHGDINYMVENIAPKNKLETLIADHVKDAIIAINSSNNINKNILVKLGETNNYYELSVYDTGVDFEIDTLLKLGLEKTTTHEQTGGSGIGFMTTFETMKACMASLIIEENPTESYTKSVTIRFDGKNEYKIISHRAEEIKHQNENERIIIENK